MAMRWLKRIAIAVAALIVLLALALWWLLGTHSGLDFALARVVAASDGAVSVQRARGDLAGPLTLEGLHYDNGKGTEASIAEVSVDLSLWSLLGQTIEVQQFDARGVTIHLPAKPAPEPQDNKPFSLAAPIDIVIHPATVQNLKVLKGGKPLFVADRIELAGAWTDDGLKIDQLRLQSPQGHVSAEGRLVLGTHYQGQGKASFSWQLGQQRIAGTLTTHSDGETAEASLELSRPFPATLHVRARQGGDYPWQLEIDVPRADVAELSGGSLKTLAVDLHARGTTDSAHIEGTLTANGWPVALAPLELALDRDQGILSIRTLKVTSKRIPGVLTAEGQVALQAEPLSAQLQLAWQDVKLPAELAGQVLLSHGQLQFHGSAEDYAVGGEVHIGPPGQVADLKVAVSGGEKQVLIKQLVLQQPDGRVEIGGQVNLQPVLAWDLEIDGHNFNPGQLLAGWDGSLDFDLASTGHLKPDLDARLQIHQLGGSLRGRPISGEGKLHVTSGPVVAGNLALSFGSSHVAIDAEPGHRNDIDVKLDIASLAHWVEGAAGRIQGRIHLGGALDALAVQATLAGRHLEWKDYSIEQVDIDADIPDVSSPGGRFELAAANLDLGAMQFDSVRVDANGTSAHHTATLTAGGPQLQFKLALEGHMQGQQWLGQLTTLTLQPQAMPGWHLAEAVALKIGPDVVDVGQLCLTAGEPTICLRAHRGADGALDASYRIEALPLKLLADLAPSGSLPVRIDGQLMGQGTIHRSADGVLTGHAQLASEDGRVYWLEQPGEALLGWNGLHINADLQPGQQAVEVHAKLSRGGHIDGRLSVSGDARKLDGQLQLDIPSLAFAGLFTTALANVEGSLEGRFAVDGTLEDPVLSGEADIRGLAAEIPAAGLQLSNGEIHAETAAGGGIVLHGSVHSGEGRLLLTGQVGMQDEGLAARLVIQGEQFLAVDIPAAEVVVSPALALQYDASGIEVAGRVDIDHASIDVSKLPMGGVTHASPDVVIMNTLNSNGEEGKALPITATVSVNFGEDTHIKGFGLKGTIHGALTVEQEPGRAPIGHGQITVDGTYHAYGQDLRITQGRIMFASTPLANPGLDIRAVRDLNPHATVDQGQAVGLHITGTAQNPVLTVFSDPSMPQADALSYLVTGKPLSEVRGGEGNMVTAAAQALGSAAGDLLAKGIGSKLGLSLGVSSNRALNGAAAFTVGKYLSPKLYLQYGVGLFEPGTVITLRYIISEHWNFEAIQATEFSRAAFNYRYER